MQNKELNRRKARRHCFSTTHAQKPFKPLERAFMPHTCYRHIFSLRCCPLLSWRELIWCESGSVSWGNLLKKHFMTGNTKQEEGFFFLFSFFFRERSPYSLLEEKSQRNSIAMCLPSLSLYFLASLLALIKENNKKKQRIQCLEKLSRNSASVFGCGYNIKSINTTIPSNLPRFLS